MIFSSEAFIPVNNLPLPIEIIKSINPIYYGVDLVRNILFTGSSQLRLVASNNFGTDLIIFTGLGLFFFITGTYLFTQKGGNK